MNETAPDSYGTGNTTFRAAEGEAGLRRLVDRFYDLMESDPAYAVIRAWHPADLSVSRDKLARFLCGWTGGPRRYSEKYGKISIPGVHVHLPVTTSERDLWLDCMRRALDDQPYADALKQYLLEQLAVPAERIRAYRAAQEESHK